MRKFYLLVFSVAVLTIPQGLFADVLDDLDGVLLRGDLVSAKATLDDLHSNIKKVGGADGFNRLDTYTVIYEVLSAWEDVTAQYEKFRVSAMEPKDAEALRYSITHFSVAWKELTVRSMNPLKASKPLIDRVNSIFQNVNDINKTAGSSFNSAEASRAEAARVQQAEADKQRQAQIAEEKARQEQAQADEARQRQEAEDAQRAAQAAHVAQAQADEDAANQAQQERNDRIDKLAKKLGYKGLNKEAGIAHFLANSQRDGNLESGLGYVFYTKLTPAEEAIDGMWKLTQVVDGWEIYSWMDEVRQITIVTKTRNGLPMEGQQLKSGFYVFKGNKQFTLAINGAAKLVQEFEPVNIPEPEATQ